MSQTLFREPLLHFAALGLILFAVYSMLNDPQSRSADEIVVDGARTAMLSSNFERTWQRPPTDEELQGLIDAWVREEVLYREGVAIGFDLNDPIIRRRVAQKMSFVADGLVPEVPQEHELENWLRANIGDYVVPASYTLQQVYIDPGQHEEDLETVLEAMLHALQSGASPASLGDSTMLLARVESASAHEVARVFGTQFVAGLAELTLHEWGGPVTSGYGLHLVRMDRFVPAREPDLDEVRTAVERDLLNNKSNQLNEAFYKTLLERYDVRIESANNDRQAGDAQGT